MKTPLASHGILEINYRSPPCHIWIPPNKLINNHLPIPMTEYFPYFIVKYKIECLPASVLHFCLPYRSMLTSYCQVMKDSNTATTNKTPRLIKTTQMADIVNNSPVPPLPQELKKAEVSLQSSGSLPFWHGWSHFNQSGLYVARHILTSIILYFIHPI